MHQYRNNPPIIGFARNPWQGAWMNRQQLLSRLAERGWPIVYSTGALTIWDRHGARWVGAGLRSRFEDVDGVLLDRPSRLFLRWPRCPAWDDRVIKWHSNRLVQAAQKAGNTVSTRDTIALIFDPMLLPYVEHVRADYNVLYAYDAFPLTPGWTAVHGDRLERIVRKADLVIASSVPIARHLPPAAEGKLRILPNGADAAAFEKGASQPCPADLAAIPEPRIGYVGNITRKVDLATIATVASQRPEWHWVIVGATVAIERDSATMQAHEACRSLENVHFLGHKHHGELPAYVNHMTVNTMCYRQRGGWWEAIYPLKLHEYLAAGRPVVSADIESVREFSDVIATATTPDEWIEALSHALTSGGIGTPDKRRRVAYQNTWDKRVDLLEKWLSELIGSAGPA